MLTLLFSDGLTGFWKSLGIGLRLFCLVLSITSLYCLFSATKAMLRLRSLRRLNPAQDLVAVQLSLTDLRDLMANVRQAIVGTFYLFGFVLFLNLQTVADFADHSKTPMGYYVFRNFFFYCSFAASALLVFLLLHLVQWSVSGRLNSYARHLKASGDHAMK